MKPLLFVQISDERLKIVCEMIQLWLERERIDARMTELRGIFNQEPDEEKIEEDDPPFPGDEEVDPDEEEEPEPDIDALGEPELLPVRMH